MDVLKLYVYMSGYWYTSVTGPTNKATTEPVSNGNTLGFDYKLANSDHNPSLQQSWWGRMALSLQGKKILKRKTTSQGGIKAKALMFQDWIKASIFEL